ncbi:MAG: hypothetical protein ACTSSO_06775, partial [Candidatus Hodarchaeales archaeon]
SNNTCPLLESKIQKGFSISSSNFQNLEKKDSKLILKMSLKDFYISKLVFNGSFLDSFFWKFCLLATNKGNNNGNLG